MIDFTGKVALVTGGSRGIGAATVKAMAAAGCQVVVHYGFNRATAQKTADEAGSDRCRLVAADLSEPRAAKQLWADALAWKDQIDIVVNNAGVFHEANVASDDDHWADVWARTMQINLTACADLSREAVNHWLAKSSGGAIVNVASRAAFRGDAPDFWAYAASKGGMISMTKTIARAYASDGIYAYGVAPGFTDTDMAVEAFEMDPDLRARLIADIPVGDIAPASQIANTICFLASGLATHATGQTIDVNGASYVR